MELKNEEFWKSRKLVNKKVWEKAFAVAVKQTKKNIEYFGEGFQSPQTYNNRYFKMDNIEWTDGFWTGMLWLAYEKTKDEDFKNLAEKNIKSFKHRIDNKIFVDHHDMGFLYSLSGVAGYKVSNNKMGRDISIDAAKHLATRFHKKGEFIQAWGELGEKDNYRLIIDCLLNIPLMFWAAENSDNKELADIARKHYKTTVDNAIRNNSTTFHTFYFDPKTGNPTHGVTRQGYTDDSCWARGQAWGVYGLPLTAKYTKGKLLVDWIKWRNLTNHFVNSLPKDYIPYWDLVFNDDDGLNMPKDSSASAIAVCGILEAIKFLNSKNEKEIYLKIAHTLAKALIDKCLNTKDIEPGAPILLHGMYNWNNKNLKEAGNDEGNIWGDYFFMEMLMRLMDEEWNEYW